MEIFKHLPEPFRIRVIEPVKRTTRAYREEAIIRAGMNPFLLDSEDVFIDLLTDSGTGAITQDMQAAMLRGDEAYSGSRSYYALQKAVQEIFGYSLTIPTHQGRGAEQIYIPVLIKKREQEKGLDRKKMVALSNYFFDTTQGHTQINCCVAKNVYTREAFDTSVTADFKGNFDLVKLEEAILEAGPANVPYIVSTITCNSAGGQPVSIANLKAVYEIARKYDIPVIMDSARFAENAYFIQQREPGYADWSIEAITLESYKYADGLAMSAKKDAMVQMGGLLCFKDDSMLDVYTECRTLCVVQGSALLFFMFAPDRFPYTMTGHLAAMLNAGFHLMLAMPLLLALGWGVLRLPLHQKLLYPALMVAYFAVMLPHKALLHAVVVQHLSALFMPLLYLCFGAVMDLMVFVALYSWLVSRAPAQALGTGGRP